MLFLLLKALAGVTSEVFQGPVADRISTRVMTS